ncbi:MAG: DUF3772 domain-containing protein [Paracoccaceae bacterium]
MTGRLYAPLICLWVGLVGFAAVSLPSETFAQETQAAPDYSAWSKIAKEAEDTLSAARVPTAALETLRAQIVEWRSRFDAERKEGAPQIEAAQDQLTALGAVPEGGGPEAPGIAKRRQELVESLAELQAPVLAADEAFQRADGLIRQADALVRERQARELLRLLPTPLNPLHWPSGNAVLLQGLKTLKAEVATSWQDEARRAEMRNKLPAILASLVAAILLMWRGAGFMERLSRRLQMRATLRGRTLVSALVSLGQVVVPTLGMTLVLVALVISTIPGPRLLALAGALPLAAFAFFFARWLASWLFANEETGGQPIQSIRLTDRPSEARFLVSILGLVSAAEIVRRAFTTEVRPPLSQAAQAVWLAPLVCVAAVFLFRLGLLLRRQVADDAAGGEALLFRSRMIGYAGNLIMAVAILAPILALVGYVVAANALIWPMINSMALIGSIILLQRFLTDVYILVTRSGSEGREALIPVLTGFVLALLSLPIFALIWGARGADLSEIWTRFQQGVQFGQTTVSPIAVLTLIVVFVLGYMITRVMQGAMRSQILPRTQLSKGAQTAAVSGLGYVGIFLAALAAITTAGIDLSGLAIVAGALSVGIGFGLQNVVQNFIAGIILLVERPISDGDWIEVGDKSGTVKQISVRSTRIITADQSEVVVPNGDFISGVVTNWTRENLQSRLIVPVTVAMGSDTRKVEQILRDIIDDQPLALIDPPPQVLLVSIGPVGINFELRAILSDLNFRMPTLSAINHAILERFAEAGIEIPMVLEEVQAGGVGLPRPRRAPSAVVEEGAKPAPKAPAKKRAGKKVPAGAINNDPASDPDERREN